MKKKKATEAWKLHDADDADDVDDDTAVADALRWINNETYANSLGFPESFAQYIGHLDEDVVIERLNRSLPVSLWQFLLKPLQSLFRRVWPFIVTWIKNSHLITTHAAEIFIHLQIWNNLNWL